MLIHLFFFACFLGLCVEAETAPQEDFEYVCEQVTKIYPDVSCDEIEPPLVIMTKLTRYARAHGAYMAGEPYIFINPEGPHPDESIIHEMTHYVLYETGKVINATCLGESLARVVAGQNHPYWRLVYNCPEGEDGEPA